MNDLNLEPEDKDELSDIDYLRDLQERIMHIPVMYDVDGYDLDRLGCIINAMEIKEREREKRLDARGRL